MRDRLDRPEGEAPVQTRDPGAAPAGRTATAEEPVAPRRTAPVEEPVAARRTAAVEDPVAARRAGARARARHGGFDWVGSFIGFVVALFFLCVFVGIVGVIVGSIGYRPGTGSLSATMHTAGWAAAIGYLVATFLAYLIGGYSAGRTARYDGAINGLGVVFWTILLAIALAITGFVLHAQFPVTQVFHLGMGGGNIVASAVISGIITFIVMIVGGVLGGAAGSHYHRRVDRGLGVTV